MRAAFMSMTVADCSHCVFSSLYLLEPPRFGLRKASFGPTTPKTRLNEPKRVLMQRFLADERKSDLSGATLATVNKGPASAPSLE